MKRSSKNYRLNMIKQVALRKQQVDNCSDPMARYIYEVMHQVKKPSAKQAHKFAGNHYDDHVGGWVSDSWSA
ncbi:hypothetical protein G7083_11365 [Vibrio sp. HDW18]|uniref:hypothetical protein n=1 Tax=Vibrio sp. HDW18 TaxID=2714948 RepID=UPI001409F9FA|nr:hypothetical protein [Vibrio sp. HDW18]QIL86395.1 hypothetical protein G7083_11365 [Vibrio sp. HDW18]